MIAPITGSRPVALVTGAARRVGAAICRELAGAGLDICLTYRTSADEANALAASLPTAARTDMLDLDDLQSVQKFAARLATEIPRLDVLVHNASAYFPMALDAFDGPKAESLMRIHAIAPLAITAILEPMLSASTMPGGGAVVCMCDIHALGRPRKGFAPYAMSKAAVGEMVRSLARDLAPKVRVNALAPGVVAWPEDGYESDAKSQDSYIKRVPLARAGTPEEAASAVRWLALEASYITGVILPIDGGRRLA